jgi:hypothetical protein
MNSVLSAALHSGMAIAMLFTALVRFSRTYFLGLIFGNALTPRCSTGVYALQGLFIVTVPINATTI